MRVYIFSNSPVSKLAQLLHKFHRLKVTIDSTCLSVDQNVVPFEAGDDRVAQGVG